MSCPSKIPTDKEPTSPRLQGGGLGDGLGTVIGQLLELLVQVLSGLGQVDGLAHPLKQLKPQLLLHQSDLLGQIGLRGKQVAGRYRKILVPGRLHKIANTQ